jgi:hypothetical protein
MTMTLIETKTLGAEATAINFTSIPQTFTDLFFVLSLRDALNGNSNNTILAINGSTANGTGRNLVGTGSSADSGSDNLIFLASTSSNTSTANTFGNASIYIPNYTSSANKSISMDAVTENNGTAALQEIRASLWSNSAAITEIEFRTNATVNYRVGSTISLYGILKGSDGIVTTS